MPDIQRNANGFCGALNEMQKRYTTASSIFKSSVGEIKKLARLVKSEHASAMLQVQQQAAQLREKSQRLSELQNQVAHEEAENQKLDRELQRVSSAFTKAEEQGVGLRADICQLEGKVADLGNVRLEQKQQLLTYEHELKNLEKELHACLGEKKSLESKLEAAKAEVDRTARESAAKISLLNKELKDMEGRVVDVRAQEEAIDGEKYALRQALKEVEGKLENVERDVSVQAAKCCKLRVQKNKYKVISERFQQRLAEQDHKLAALSKTEEDLAKARSDYQQKCSNWASAEKSLSDKNAALQTEIAKSTELLKENEFLKMKLRKERDEKSELAQTNETVYLELDHMRKSMQAADAEKANEAQNQERLEVDLRSIIKQLEEDLQLSRADLKCARKSLASLTQDHADLQFTVRELTLRCKVHSSALEQASVGEEKLHEEIKSLERELLIAREKLKDCQCKKKSAKDQSEVETSLLRMLTDLKVSRIETERLAPQIEADEQARRVDELEGKLRSEEENRKCDQLEKLRLTEQIKTMRNPIAVAGRCGRILPNGRLTTP